MHLKTNLARNILVSPEDEHFIRMYLFHINSAGYAATTLTIEGKRKTVRLHKLIYPDIELVDHISRDKLDNRRPNLRSATVSQNQHNRTKYSTNSSGYKGVAFHLATKKWRAKIAVDGKDVHIGVYLTKEKAAAAYNKKAAELHKDFAVLNTMQ